MAIKIELDKKSERTLLDLAKEFQKYYNAANAMACAKALNMIRSGVRKGGNVKHGIPTFPEKAGITLGLHGNRPWYGQYGKPSVIRRWRRGGLQMVGWIDNVYKWAEALQTKSNREFTSVEKKYIRSRGYTPPARYERPDRMVIEPFTSYLVQGKYAQMVREGIDNQLRGLTAYGKVPKAKAVK